MPDGNSTLRRSATKRSDKRKRGAHRILPDAYEDSLDGSASKCLSYFRRLERWTYFGTTRGSNVPRTRNGGMVRPPRADVDLPLFASTSSYDGPHEQMGQIDAALEAELSNARDVLRRSQDLPKKAQEALGRSLREIDERRRDHRLFLGIVGEFSSGKSTLINALTRNAVLATSVLPATTQAPTVIAAGIRDDAEVFMADGRYVTLLHDGVRLDRLMRQWLIGDTLAGDELSVVRDFVVRHTADEKMDGEVQQVNVFCCNPSFHRGLAIVDTPGINAEGKATHVERTRTALRDLCDAVIVVAPANAPISATLLSFLVQELGTLKHRLVFVLTKVDLLRPHDRDAVVRHTEAVLRRELGIEEPSILPVSALEFIDSMTSTQETEASDLSKGFLEAESAILDFLRSNRRLILLENVLSLVGAFNEDLRAALRRMKTRYRKQHKRLIEAQLPDLASSIAAWKTDCQAKLHSETEQSVRTFRRQSSESTKSPMKELRSAVASANNKKALHEILKGAIARSVSKAAGAVDSACSAYVGEVVRASTRIHKAFFEQFLHVYARLAPCSQDALPELRMESCMEDQLRSLHPDSNAPIVGRLDSAVKKDGYFQTGGVIAGAAIGAAVAGPVGFFVGGFLGSKVRNVFGPGLDELKRDGLQQIGPIIEKQMDALEDAASGFADDVAVRADNAVDVMVGAYAVEYERLADQLIEEDEQEKAKLLLKEEETDRTLRHLSTSKKKLQRLAASVRGWRSCNAPA